MSETFQCGDHGALIAYLYDECAPGERETIAAHLSRCAECANEISGLTLTRRAIAMWAPPAVDLGLQITRKMETELAASSGTVLAFERPQASSQSKALPWWKSPLPAWAQVAAAIAIFAAGLSAGLLRNGARPAEIKQTVAAAPVTAPVAAVPSKQDLTQLEQRLRAEMVQLARSNATPAATATPVAARVDDDGIMQKVQALVEQSEARQRVEFTERMVRQATALEAQRRTDLESMGATVSQIGTEVRQHRQAIDENNRILVRVSQAR